MSAPIPNVIIRDLGLVDYEPTLLQMQTFTTERASQTTDEIWLLEHPPVFTQGQAGKAEHLLAPGDIPVVKVDRGGQVTYHGPGQLVAYILLDLNRYGADIRKLVTALEQSVIDLLGEYSLTANARADAPGVYVDESKICSLGLRVKKGRTFHGLALNVDMDLSPFSRINPCGYEGLAMTQLKNLIPNPVMVDIKRRWVSTFCAHFNAYPIWKP